MMLTRFFSLVIASLSFLTAKPNVIIVMADDLGIGDISPTSPECKIKTPHLQKMADEGITFLDAHTPSSVCTPTRYGLLTGRYNWRSSLAKGVLRGTSKHLIPAHRPTIAHMLKRAGYHTSMIGKWHLGWDWHIEGDKIDFSKPVLNGPDINGFDQYYGHCGSLDMAPYVWVDTGKPTAIPTREEGVTRQENPYGWYRKGPIAPDFNIEQVLPHLFQKTISRIQERAKEDNPFFIYLPLPAPHTPIVPVPPFKDASKINPYADFVMQMDYHMGELFAALKKSGVDDNTLVIFTSDNGCSPEANFKVLKEFDHHPSGKFRGHKADIYEGGHRVPLIFRWPAKIKGDRTVNALAGLTDLYTTLEDITDQERKPLGGEDGFSLWPLLSGEGTVKRKDIIHHSISGHFAIREGDWKLCLASGSGGWSAPRESVAKKKGLPEMQLFNLKNDPAEKINLISKNPAKAETLLALLKDQVENGRSTPGEPVINDREVSFMPEK
ncbi:MAG: sulfatase family protein [Akkermansiaceae bacterium]